MGACLRQFELQTEFKFGELEQSQMPKVTEKVPAEPPHFFLQPEPSIA